MNNEYRELRRLLASYLRHIVRLGEASCLQIMYTLKTSNQILVMVDYLDKHLNETQSEEHLCQVAVAISEQIQ